MGKTDTVPPAAPILLSAVLEGPNNENVLISWSLSSDDGSGDDDVSHYAIYFSTKYDYGGEGYVYLGKVGKGQTFFVHSLAGNGDWSNYFYFVQANDTSGNSNWTGQAGKFVRYLEKGKQIASIPLVQVDTTLEEVLKSLDGSYKHVRYYRSSDQSQHWKTYWTFKTYRTLFEINRTMGFWIDMTRADYLVVAGLVPEVTCIRLGHEWNFVGYPSFLERRVFEALAAIDWKMADGYGDVPPFHLKHLGANDIMTAGEGYWVWVDQPQIWEVSNRPSPPPYIVWTYPADGDTNVSLNTTVLVKFSKEMNTSSVTWLTIPDPAGYSLHWGENNTLLRILRVNPWPENTTITFEITYGEDLEGNPLIPGPVPNPWSFTTTYDYPYIEYVYPPPYGQGGRPVGLSECIMIWFSEPMDADIVVVEIMPNATVNMTWSSDFTMLYICPVPRWESCTYYSVRIEGRDLAGFPLVSGPVPNPFTFATECGYPYIVQTDPADQDVNVPLNKSIVIVFSEEMKPTTLLWTIAPDPGGWTASWSQGNTTVTLWHSIFETCMTYEVWVTSALDLDDNNIVPGPAPNPWKFSTVSCPYVAETYPIHNQTNVSVYSNITIVFSESMNTQSLNWTITPDPGGWNEMWMSSYTTLVLSHTNPFDPRTSYVFVLSYLESQQGIPLCNLPFVLVFRTY